MPALSSRLSQAPTFSSSAHSISSIPINSTFSTFQSRATTPYFPPLRLPRHPEFTSAIMSSPSDLFNGVESTDQLGFEDHDIDLLAEVANKAADAAGEVICRYFRKKFEILDKADLSESCDRC